MVILKIGRTRHVHYIKEWIYRYMYLSSDLGRNILSFLLVFFFYLFPLRFPKSWHTCYNGTLEVSLPIVFELQCLIDPCCCILIRLFFQRSSGGYFWRWMQWAVLTCVMQFHDQFEIIIPLNNSWISLFVSAILKLCLGWMWKPLHHLQVNANLIYFYYGFYVGL